MDELVVIDEIEKVRLQEPMPGSGILDPALCAGLLKGMLNLIPFGLILISPAGAVMMANRFAVRELDSQSPIFLYEQQVRARRPQDSDSLRQAIQRASDLGRQCLLRMGGESTRPATIAVAPMGDICTAKARYVALIFGKREVCEELSAEAYGRGHGLTWTEIRVLKQLIAGRSPIEAAACQGVAISTMRTQIASIRDKTSASDIVALVREAALLPPLVISAAIDASALR